LKLKSDYEKMLPQLSTILGFTDNELELDSQIIRSRETASCNFIVDVVRLTEGADCCYIGTGTFKGNGTLPPGSISIKDFLSFCIYDDFVILLEISGSQLWEAMENALAKYSDNDGRFPAVSGMQLNFDLEKPCGQRM
jgi:2',3'-cyclic-nucleotide 2'-phosphodiesterase (5'-nucleotidase family)